MSSFSCPAQGGPRSACSSICDAWSSSIALKTDFKNAFNTRKRSGILSTLFKHSQLGPIWRLSHWAYRSPSTLLGSYQGIISDPILSAEGVKQGDVLSSFLFSLSVHPGYCNSVNGLSQVTAVAAVDDFNLVGPIDEVFQAFDTLALVTKPSGLLLCNPKCVALWLAPSCQLS